MANNGKSYSVQKELDKKYGVKSSSGRASGNTSVQDALDQKYNYENSSQRRASVQDWSRRYNEAARAYGETGGTLTDESGEFRNSVNTLIQDYGKIKGYSGRMGLPNGQDYVRALRGMVDATGKNRQRAATASGLIPEDANALAGQKQKYERMLFELQKQMKENRGAESVQAEIEGVERSKATEEREKEIRSLQGTLGDINSQLNIYNRIDKFGDDVTAKYAGGNSMEAREAWRTGKDGREQTFREKEQALRKDSTPYAARESGVSGNAYAAALSNPQSADFTERLNDYKSEKNRKIIDRLDEYLTWFDGLSEEAQNRVKTSDVTGQAIARDIELAKNPDPGNRNRHWEQMTEDERNAAFRIASTEGTEAAAKYLDDLQMTLDRRHTLAMEEAERAKADGTPLAVDMLRGVATVPENLIGAPISFIGNAVDTIKGKGLNPYSNANFLLNQSGAVREASSQEVYRAVAGDGSNKKLDFLGTLASNAYQAGLSTLDSLAGMATMGKFYTISMGMGAASQRMRELVESGASDREIYVGAIGSGILEALFEKVSLDTFSDQWIKANPEKFIRKALIQAGVEGSEEVFTEISNQILDAVNRGVNSDHNVRVRALMKENPGMSETEAEQQAASEDAQEVFWAGFGGALSGGLSSFGGLAIEGHKARQGGTEILSRGQAGEVLQNALELRPNDKAAQNLQAKLSDNTLGKKGRDLSGLYRVAQQNAADMTHADVEAVRAGLENRLTEMGVPNNGKATAEAIIKQITGEKLSLTDRLALAKNRDAAATVRSEIISAAIEETAENKWVRDIKTFQLGRLGHGKQAFGTAETQTQKSARETMEKALNQVMGSNSAIVSAMYDEGQSRSDFTTEAAEIYRAGQDGRGLDGVSLSTIGAKEAGIIYDLGVRSAEGVGTYDYIEEGQAYRKSDSTPVNVTGFASMGAEPTVSIGNGETVKASDITFGSFGESRLYNTIAKMGVDTQTANDMLKAAENANINASTYSVALNNAYMQGLSGIAFGNIRENSEAMRLDADTRKAAWSAGRAQAERNDRAKQSVTDKGKHGRKAGGLTVEDSAKNVKLNRQQEAGMNAARVLAGMGLNVSVFASTEAERKDGAYNGIFRSADGSIRVDLNAGKDGQGVMGYALSHEFTHFVEELSAEKFRKFTDVLFDVLGKNDVDVNRLIEAKEAVLRNTEEYKGRSEKELRALAYSEAVAEMMEPVLTDTDAISRISQKIKQQDRSLWGKIKDFIKGIVEKLKAAYRNMEPDSAIARLTRQTVTNSEAVLDAFSEAAADAVINYNLQETAKENGLRYSDYTFTNRNGESVDYLKSARITDKETLDFLNDQETVTTYKTMQLVDGKLYPPMAAVIQGSYEDASELGKWEMAVEHPELIKDVNGKAKFTLNKGKGQGSLAAAYNPYMHSSNLVLNDQFSGAYLRPNLVTVECKVPVSELTSGYKAQYAKDSVGWHSWHTGTVAGALRQQTGVERQVLLSRYIMPVRILSNAEVAGMYAELLNGTGIAVPDNVVPPALLAELKKAGVTIRESGKVQEEGQKNSAREGVQFMSRNSNDSEIVSIKQQIAEAKDELTQMQSVANVAVQDLSKMTQKQRYDWAVNELKRTGYKVDRPNFGVIEFTPKQINTGMNYLRSAEDVAAFAVLPKVLKQGNIIFENKNHKGRQFATFTISAPVTINGTTGYMAVVVQETSSRHYHTHRIVLPDGSAFKFEMQHSDPSGGFAQNSTRLATNTNAASSDSVAQPNADVKGNVRYSARQATKNLVALHNLTEEKLLKSLELGGFPMPSIAITKADIPHTNFGNITVVFGKETIDPKARRENTVYSADAWTPVVPRVEYEADSKVTDRVYNRLGALKNQVAEYFQHDLDTLRYSLEDRLNRDGGEAGILENLRNNYALKAAFLEEQGTHIEQQTKQVETAVNSISSEMEDKLLNVWEALGKPTPDEIGSTSMKEIRDTYGSELEKAYPGMTKSAFRMSTVLGKLRAYLSGEANATKTSVVADGEAMKKAVDAAVDQGAFERWARELFSGIEKSKGVYNGKERFTPSGNLRSFKATHIPATLEGIVQAMRSENGGNTKNVSGFSGVKTLRAATAEEFGSIADMHRAEGRLQNLTEEQVSQIQDKLGDRLYKLMNDIDAANTKSRWSDNSFIRMDSIGENLTEIGESGRYTPENVKRVFAKYGMEVSDHTAQEVVQLLFDISQMPVNIFEAKPKRAVRFEEIRNVLVPDTASQKLLRELDNRGIPYQVYEAGNEAQRQQMVSQMDDVRFSSRAQQDSEYMELAKDPEYNELELLDMVDAAAAEAGFEYRRNAKRKHKPSNDVEWQMFVRGIDHDQSNYGDYTFLATDKGAIQTEDIMPKLRQLAEEFYGEQISDEEINPPDIVDSAGIWDDMEFVQYMWDNYFEDIFYSTGEMPAIVTEDGMIVYGDDFKRVKSGDAVEYDDNGNVIPLSRRFDTGKEDIRYSARNPQAQVEAENERLKTELEYLKKLVQIQKRGNKDFTLDRNSLRNAARALMNANNAKGNVAELAEILDRVYRYAGTEPEITWERFAEQAGEAADWLMENRVKERDPYAQQILDAVAKRRVSLNEAQIGEIEYRYGSLSEFKKAIKGSIILDQNANTSLDQLWQELSGEYPGTFDAGTTDADMPGAFADIVDELRDSESTNEAERQYYADEERNQIIRQVYDGYWDVDPVQSVSDKAKKEIDQLKAEHREAVRELKAENRQLKSDAQSQVAAAVREYRQQNNAMTREMKKTYERQLKEVQKGYEKFRSQAESLSSESTLRYQNEFYNALMGTENLGKAKIPELRKKFRELAVENSGKDMDARKARQSEYTRLLDEFLTSRDIGKLRTTIQEQRDRAKAKVEAARVTEQRGKLYRAVNEINRWLLNPTKTLYVPDSLAPAVTKFMQGLTEAMESPQNSWNVQGALETLQGQYQKLTQMNEGVFTQEYNQGILDLLDNAINAVGGTDFNKLSASQIEDVYSAVRSVLTAIRNENKMFAANLNKTYAEAAAAVLREESALPNRKPTTGTVQDKAEKFGWNQLKPVYAMMRLGSDTLLKQYNNLRAGEDKWQRIIAAARAYGLGTMAKYHYDQWDDSLMKLDTETGTVELSLQERMSLYAYARREQAFEHLTKGGFVLSDKNTRTVKNRLGIETEQKVQDYNAYVLTAEQVAGIRGAENILQLTEAQRQFADAMQDYLSTVCAELNNEISRALYGVSIAKEKYYWPIRSSGVFSEMIRNQMQNPSNRQKNAGHMKATVRGANNAIELMGFMETWATHVNNTAMYNAFTLPMEDFMRVWNWRDTSGIGNRSMRQLILQKHGQAGVDYIDTFIKDLNKGVRGDPRESLLNSMLGKFKKGAVSASLSVAIQQPSAVGRSLKYIDPKYFLGARVEGVDGINATWEVMQQYAPVVGIKDIGRFDMDMGRSTIDILSGKNETGVMATIDKLSGFLPEYMDKVTWVAMWEACKRQVKAQNPSLRGEALLTKAGELFTKTITETQVYDSVFSRSGLMRSPSVAAKAVTAFMAEPTTTANMVYQAIQDFRHGDRTGAARTLASVGTAIVLNSLLASLVYASRDDDEEKTWLEKYLKSFTAEMIDGVNPLGYIPVVKDIFSVFQGYDVIRSDMSQWADLAKTLQKFTKAWKSYGEADEDDREARKEALKNAGIASTNLLASILNLGGIPLRNLLREIQGGVNIVKDIQRGLPSDSRTKGYAIWEALNEYMPQIMRRDDGKAKQVYKAVTSGSAAWVNRLKSTYKDEDTFNRAVVTALVNNDSRIREAARAAVSGNSAERDRLAKEIVKEGRFTEEQVEAAIEKRIGQLPGANYDDMLDALRNGGDVKAAQAELAKYGYTQTQMESKVKSAAKEWYQGGVISAIDARKMLRDYGGMLTRDAQATVQKWTALLSTGTDFDEIQDEYLTGNLSRSRAVEMYVKFGGATQADAEAAVKKWDCEKELGVKYDDLKDAYLGGDISADRVLSAMMKYGGVKEDSARATVEAYKWIRQHPKTELDVGQVKTYTKAIDTLGYSVEDAGISESVYLTFLEKASTCTGEDRNGDGRTDSGSVRNQVVQVIDALPISGAQKDALYFAKGYAKRDLHKAPWH